MASGEDKKPEKNFWLWGEWGKRDIKEPFLTQKVDGRVRDVILGSTFIIALKEDGTVVSWGEDKAGCLGLGSQINQQKEPKPISFPVPGTKIKEIQYGRHHVLALSEEGKVFAWGDNLAGCLGVNDTQMRQEPFVVEELRDYTVVQILAIECKSYALTSNGIVFAWGENKDGCIGLEHQFGKVLKPEPMVRMKDDRHPVKRLVVKECGGKGGKAIVAIVEPSDPSAAPTNVAPPGSAALMTMDVLAVSPNSKSEQHPWEQAQLSEGAEREIFDGVELMRKVMKNTQEWWKHVMRVRHGSPYSDNPAVPESLHEFEEAEEDGVPALQLDLLATLDRLEAASYELDLLIQTAKAQLSEIGQNKKKGSKNVRFILAMFMDDCRLRREKIRRTVAAKQLIDHKRAMHHTILSHDPQGDEITILQEANKQLTRMQTRVRNVRTEDTYTRVLQDSISQCIENKLMLHETQIQVLETSPGQPVDLLLPALRIIKERWGELKRFSVYNLYQECTLRGQGSWFKTDDEMLAFLVQSSDAKIDQIIQIDRDRLLARDSLVPAICYDLLVENAELRKMSNTYQLKVLLMKKKYEKNPTLQAA